MSHLQDLTQKAKEIQAFETSQKHTWCSGCGNFGILNALQRAFALEGYAPDEVISCYDVGCNGNESDKIIANTIHGLHGRVIPLSAGVKLANSKMPVVAQAGDGATFSEGINHLIHAIRSDYNILFIVHNNQNYGLTTGQASSTTPKYQKMNGSSDGKFEEQLYPLEMVLSLRPTFVARSYSGDVEHITQMIREGLNHNGFAYLEVLQSCPTYNRFQDHQWYLNKIKDVSEYEGYDNTDLWSAKKIVEKDRELEFPIGVIYRTEGQNFLERLPHRQGFETSLVEEVKKQDISELLKEFV